MAEKIAPIEQIPDTPDFSNNPDITVHPAQPEPLPRGADESSSWRAALRRRLEKIAGGGKGV
ncbi:hypothetical protein A2376_03240 [Candidatus Woesebacteria bacterium RIFOXYB1_FULL_47_31]|uniref:Uncharacterized protein n=4 Tax=Candidatus Woeseibacteriota TaxID=1752722 RepID=A0A1F8D7L8_9BACT|nr:MAG: hypothetical protein A2197_02620 [Candidatus Woesebacteria bacterium RIFOXYA1_FULL_48_16]OGM84624.1 MAG: hypothetical protein A2376_03240 [Candidatus Woesebacteria bacterium RIFOXYB1_FULL_47_31]OGM85194.1 MAG: hypothetical protein A2435_00455 [Candidatus Woesebacteria bacterium RIFOXYC1_FULL_46_16]OGM89495.1 MAG: hypothetical protein A2597_03370 [Candidatus Woesebacteria bacterium RIFOXYD1_FULL_46_19]